MNSTYILGGIALIGLGVLGLYYIRELPGTALFTSVGMLAGVFLVGKGSKKF